MALRGLHRQVVGKRECTLLHSGECGLQVHSFRMVAIPVGPDRGEAQHAEWDEMAEVHEAGQPLEPTRALRR